GDTTLPLLGSAHLTGTIRPDGSSYTLGVQLPNVSLGGLALTNAIVTFSGSTFGISGDATLPQVGAVHLTRTLQSDGGSVALSALLPSVTVGGLTLAANTVTSDNRGVMLEGDATLPVLGSAHLKGTLPLDGSSFTLSAPLPNLSIAGHTLS